RRRRGSRPARSHRREPSSHRPPRPSRPDRQPPRRRRRAGSARRRAPTTAVRSSSRPTGSSTRDRPCERVYTVDVSATRCLGPVLALLVLLGLAPWSFSRTAAAAEARTFPDDPIGVVELHLPNGLTVLLSENHE